MAKLARSPAKKGKNHKQSEPDPLTEKLDELSIKDVMTLTGILHSKAKHQSTPKHEAETMGRTLKALCHYILERYEGKSLGKPLAIGDKLRVWFEKDRLAKLRGSHSEGEDAFNKLSIDELENRAQQLDQFRQKTGFTKRAFMGTLLSTAGTATAEPIIKKIRTVTSVNVKKSAEMVKYESMERERLRRIQTDFKDISSARVDVKPEYERTLSQVLICHQDHYDLKKFRDLAGKLPGYTDLIVTAPVTLDKKDVESTLGRPVKLVDMKNPGVAHVWSEDVLEKVNVDGDDAFILPLFFKYGKKTFRDCQMQTRKNVDHVGDTLTIAGFGRSYVMPFFFQGGDVTFDEVDGKKIMFTSHDSVANTQRFYRQITGKEVPAKQIVDQMKTAFDADQVAVMTSSESATYTFHIDQNFCLLPGRKALALKIVDETDTTGKSWGPSLIEKEKARQNEIRSNLTSLGYELVDFEITRQQLSEGKIGLNGIPYKNQETGQYEFLMPTWEGSKSRAHMVDDGTTELKVVHMPDMSEEELQMQERNIQRLEADGIKVKKTRDAFFNQRGNTHCVTNVLAKDPQPIDSTEQRHSDFYTAV